VVATVKTMTAAIRTNASEKESQRIMEWLREDEQHLREYKRQRKLYDITRFHLYNDSSSVYPKRKRIFFSKDKGTCVVIGVTYGTGKY